MKCINCGNEIDDKKNFCPECGTKIEKKKFCTECGAELKPGQKFCSECGTKVSGGNTSSQEVPTVEIKSSNSFRETKYKDIPSNELQKIAKHGDIEAQLEMARRYNSSDSDVRQNNGEVLRWYKMAAEQGNEEGIVCYAKRVFAGRGCKSNKDEAYKYFSSLVKKNPSNGWYTWYLGALLLDSETPYYNEREALRLLGFADHQGNIFASNILGAFFFKKEDYETALPFVKKCHDADFQAEAEAAYGKVFGSSVNYSKEDFYLDLAILEMLGESYTIDTVDAMAVICKEGYGSEKDNEEHYSDLEWRAERGDDAARYEMAKCFLFGEHGYEENKEKACTYLRSISHKSETGNEYINKAQKLYADCFMNGWFVKRSEKKAREYYELAANNGNVEAQQILQDM